jgi:hypothetical protein
MKKLLFAFGVSLTGLFNVHHSIAAPPPEDRQETAARHGHTGSTPEPVVYDARGKPIGRYIPSAPALLDIGGALIAVHTERDAEGGQYDATALKWGTNGSALFYSAQDCAGAPLINHTTGGPAGARPVALVRDSAGNLNAYIGVKGRSSAQGYSSWRDVQNGTCTNTWGSAVPINAWELEKTVTINQLYPEPLTVR